MVLESEHPNSEGPFRFGQLSWQTRVNHPWLLEIPHDPHPRVDGLRGRRTEAGQSISAELDVEVVQRHRCERLLVYM